MAKTRAKLKSTNDVLKEHEVFFKLLIVIGNQRVRKSQIEKLLLDTGYCKNKTASSRLLTDFKERGLIKVEKPSFSKFNFIEATSKSVKFILGSNGKTKKVAKNTSVRDAKNAMRLGMFAREYVEKQGLTLEQALNEVEIQGFNLFTSDERYYEILNSNNVAHLSFNRKHSTFFKQEQEMKYRLERLQEHIEQTARTRQKGNKVGKFHRKIWILEDLKNRNIFFKNMKLKGISEADKNNWAELNFESFDLTKIKTLEMNFIYTVIDYRADQHEMFLNLARLYRFIRSSFYLHESFWLKKMNRRSAIGKIEINVEIVCINEICYNKLDQDKILQKLNKKIANNKGSFRNFKYDMNVTFSHLNINKNNEHISV